MGRPEIPSTIKEKVLNGWLKGIPRAQIAEDNAISTGAVSNIINEFKKEAIPNIHLLNKVAITLRKRGLNVNDFASVIRLRNMLDRLELSEDEIELLLEGISEFCFREVLDTKYFIKEMGNVIFFAKKMHTPIDKLIPLLVEKSTELNLLREKISEAKQEYESWLLKNKVREKDIEDYNKYKPFAITISRLEKELEVVKKENEILKRKLSNKGMR